MAKKRRKSTGSGDSGASWRRSPITAILAVVIIAFCFYKIFWGGAEGVNTFNADLVCQSCGFTTRKPFERKAVPYDCDKCSKPELYQAARCSDCKKITPYLAPKQEFSCATCNHAELLRLDQNDSPHACTKCEDKAMFLTHYCSVCDKTSPYNPADQVKANNDGGGPKAMGYYCSTCGENESYPLVDQPSPSCVFCDSFSLESVTPIEVKKWELGKKLNSSEQKIVDKWRAEND